MRLTNHYYKVYKKSKPMLRENQDSEKASRVIKHASKEKDLLEVIKYDVKIDEEWILKIEEGLTYVKKAILEDRRFIRHEGDVLLIEKVKKTSRESIEHLSKNTNFITRKPEEGDNLVPDKLYIVEKLHDYAVYENKFLYLLLSYLRDFLYQRLEKITDKLTTYESKLIINKDLKIKNRKIVYTLDVHDLYKNDPYLTDTFKNNKLIERIELAYYFVESLLKTDLMKEVSKTPMLKPPIVKTNVLRMNPNFKQAVDLYDYIMAYTKNGYEFIEEINKYSPFDGILSDDISMTIEQQTFVSYKYGNKIEKRLESDYLLELERERILKEKKDLEELNILRRRVRELNLDFEKYILLLEERNKHLEKELAEFNELKQKNVELEQTILNLNNDILELEETEVKLRKDLELKELEIINLINEHNAKILELNNIHQEEVLNINNKHREEVKEINLIHQEEINELNISHDKEINQIREENDSYIKGLNNTHKELINSKDNYINGLEEKYDLTVNEYKLEIKTLEKNIKEERSNLNEQLNHISTEHDLFKAKYLAVSKNGDDFDFTSKEGFKELAKVKKSFDKYFKENWKLTKIKIREKVKEESDKILKEELEEKENKKK